MKPTSVEQSKRLLELGLDPDTADMFYNPVMDIDNGSRANFLETPECMSFKEIKVHRELYMPAWSSDRLLELMPAYCGIDKEKTEYVASYVCSHEVLKWSANNPLEAIYNMTVWLLEHNYIKK